MLEPEGLFDTEVKSRIKLKKLLCRGLSYR